MTKAIGKGNKRVVYLKNGERLQIVPKGMVAVLINPEEMYKINGQLDLVVQAELVMDARRVRWCSIVQEWVE